MPTYFVQAALQAQSGLNQDEIVNTFCVSGAGSGTLGGDIAVVLTALDNFYSELATEDVLSEWATGLLSVALYIPNLATGDVGPALAFDTVLFTNSSTQSLPAEVALCLSFACPPEIGTPAARRRGRMFIGPIAATTLEASQPPRPTTAATVVLADAGSDLLTELGGGNLDLHVWSRTDGEAVQATRLWVDNEYDTVRSRGLEATAREDRP